MENLSDILIAVQTKPWAFSFHQMMFILELAKKIQFEKKPNFNSDKILFQAHCKFSVPSSDFLEYKIFSTHHSLVVNQNSLIGLNGVLPQIYSEKIIKQLKEKNYAMLDFFNLFHHRYFSLKHRVEKTLQLSLNADPLKQFQYCHALAGVACDEDVISDCANAMAGLFWDKTKNAKGLIKILSSIFDFHFIVQEFVPRWIDVSSQDCAALDKSVLHNKILGSRAKSLYLGIKIFVLIDDVKAYENALPGSNHYKMILKIAQHYVPVGFSMQIKICLKNDLKSAIPLSSRFKLGYNAWLKYA